MIKPQSLALCGESPGHHWTYEDTTGLGSTADPVHLWTRNEGVSGSKPLVGFKGKARKSRAFGVSGGR